MNACEQCGHQEGGGAQDGSYCQNCILEAIDRVFVHAPDQPARSIPIIADESDTPSSATFRASTVDSPNYGSSGPSSTGLVSTPSTGRRAAVRKSQVPYRRYASIDMRPVQQMQMLSSFLNTYFPTAKARADLANRRSYLAALPDMELSATPLLRMAVDTLCFAHIGSRTSDMRLIRESQNSYGRVLNSLIQATSRPPAEIPYIDPKAVITSIMLLCLYEDAIPLPYQGTNGWAAHYWGCEQLLRAYGSSFLNMNEPFDRLLLWNLRMPIFFLGVAKRKTVVLGDPEWLGLAEANNQSKGPLTEFYRTAMRIPTLLENCDDLLNSETPSDGLERLCLEILKVRGDILTWYDGRIRANNGIFLEDPDMIYIDDNADAFDVEIEEHCYMTTSTVFTKFFLYHDVGHTIKNHTLKVLCLLVLDCTLLRLLHFQPATGAHIKPWLPKDVETNAYNLATDLCRSIHHYSSFDNLAYADWTEFLIDMALSFFEESGKASELGWCIAVRVATQLRKKRIRATVQASTLCRMGDAGPGFTTATRYKTHNILAESRWKEQCGNEG